MVIKIVLLNVRIIFILIKIRVFIFALKIKNVMVFMINIYLKKMNVLINASGIAKPLDIVAPIAKARELRYSV